MRTHLILICGLTATVLASAAVSTAQQIEADVVDKWVTAEAAAGGTDLKAKDEAVAVALRTAVEQVCGVFLTSQSKTRDYKVIYDKVLANTVGYVREHEVIETWIDGETYRARVKARVSTQKFQESWAAIAHIVRQENNPRVIIAIAEATRWTTTGPDFQVEQAGNVQAELEDFFLKKGIMLMDRDTATKVSKRDILLASIQDDTAKVAALGARFKADVVITGQATAKYGKELHIPVADTKAIMHQYVATLRVRAVRTDSGQVIVSKSFGPTTTTTLQKLGGEDKALAKLAEEAAPTLLEEVVEAWRKQVTVTRNIQLMISGMDFKIWKLFKEEADKLRGLQATRLKGIVESVADIDVEYSYSTENLADNITELKAVKLEVTEISPNRIALKVIK